MHLMVGVFLCEDFAVLICLELLVFSGLYYIFKRLLFLIR